MNTQQVIRLHGLMAKLGFKGDAMTEYKRDLVKVYSDGRAESCKELDAIESAKLLHDLQALANQTPWAVAADRMRKKILYMAHGMNWEVEGSQKVDMARVNAWCNKYAGKPLDAFKYEELPAVVSQFEMVYKSYLKTL